MGINGRQWLRNRFDPYAADLNLESLRRVGVVFLMGWGTVEYRDYVGARLGLVG